MSQELVDAVGTDNFKNILVAPKDMALLKFVKKLTLTPAEMRDPDVQTMRDVGWTDEQIWEAALEISFFSLLNRMADAYGLDYPTGGWYPPQMREQMEKAEKERAEKEKANQPKTEPVPPAKPAPPSDMDKK